MSAPNPIYHALRLSKQDRYEPNATLNCVLRGKTSEFCKRYSLINNYGHVNKYNHSIIHIGLASHAVTLHSLCMTKIQLS